MVMVDEMVRWYIINFISQSTISLSHHLTSHHLTSLIIIPSHQSGLLSFPVDIKVDEDGDLIISDTGWLR